MVSLPSPLNSANSAPSSLASCLSDPPTAGVLRQPSAAVPPAATRALRRDDGISRRSCKTTWKNSTTVLQGQHQNLIGSCFPRKTHTHNDLGENLDQIVYSWTVKLFAGGL